MKKVSAVLIGAGDRDARAYSGYAFNHPHELQFVAIAEPVAIRRESFREQHGLAPDQCFSGWADLLARDKQADTAFICTQDQMHYEPALQALEAGYHVLLEKPMAVTPEQCIARWTISEPRPKDLRRGMLIPVVRRFCRPMTP